MTPARVLSALFSKEPLFPTIAKKLGVMDFPDLSWIQPTALPVALGLLVAIFLQTRRRVEVPEPRSAEVLAPSESDLSRFRIDPVQRADVKKRLDSDGEVLLQENALWDFLDRSDSLTSRDKSEELERMEGKWMLVRGVYSDIGLRREDGLTFVDIQHPTEGFPHTFRLRFTDELVQRITHFRKDQEDFLTVLGRFQLADALCTRLYDCDIVSS